MSIGREQGVVLRQETFPSFAGTLLLGEDGNELSSFVDRECGVYDPAKL